MRKLLRHKALVMITSVVLLVLSFMMAGQLKMELMVADDPGIIGITVETQPGLTIDRVNDVLVKVEDYITKDADLDSYMLSYGSSGLSMGGSGASITAYLKDDKSRETDQVLKEMCIRDRDRVMTFREKTMDFIRIRAAKMDTGMEVPTIRDAFMSPKNSQIMTMETTTAMIMVWNTLSRELEMDSLLSLMTTTSRAGSSAFRSSTICLLYTSRCV